MIKGYIKCESSWDGVKNVVTIWWNRAGVWTKVPVHYPKNNLKARRLFRVNDLKEELYSSSKLLLWKMIVYRHNIEMEMKWRAEHDTA